ncbi:hypothetical protein NUW54_g5756 [Trametes sanguinea]|uniref:Uncharacterized protein n=1 Tax=Trametes sanguinea TaxID=158606 RepID=A0ACC1PW21_9APHY|nr:hypothetical protein NUW54_g5756 [Trametes sanguinea]
MIINRLDVSLPRSGKDYATNAWLKTRRVRHTPANTTNPTNNRRRSYGLASLEEAKIATNNQSELQRNTDNNERENGQAATTSRGRGSAPAAAPSNDRGGESDCGREQRSLGETLGNTSCDPQTPLQAGPLRERQRGADTATQTAREQRTQPMAANDWVAEPGPSNIREDGGEASTSRAHYVLEQNAQHNAQDAPPDPGGGEARADVPRTPQRKEDRMLKRTSVRVGTINMNGFGVLRTDSPDNKWRTMYRMIKANSIGILLVQETHLTPERRDDVSKMFKGRIKVLYSAHPTAPTRKEGIAVILNKGQVNMKDVSVIEVVPGRAMQVTVKCHGEDLNLLCMYAPTADGVEERKQFFQKVKAYYAARPGLARPTLMAGDFNNTEDAIDRLPVSNPDSSLTDLDELKASLGLMMTDGWRATNPSERVYTFHRGTGDGATCSRLDRIYVNSDAFERARDWQIKPPTFKTDHSLATVQLSMADAPIVGKGRPTFALHLIKDKQLSKQLKTRGIQAQQEIEALEASGSRTGERNPQTILSSLKQDWLAMARKRERETVPKLVQEIKDLECERRRVQNALQEEERVRADQTAKLTKRITDLEIRRTLQQQANGRARHKIDGERPTKYWTKLHKPCAPRDLIPAFEHPHNPADGSDVRYETDSVKMAEMARNYHDRVQMDEEDVPPPEEREVCIRTALESLDVAISTEQADEMAAEITYEECEIALKFSKSGTAPGLDGIPYELWKTLHARFTENSRHEGRESFDVVKILHRALRDVQAHGVMPGACFAEGWMAPIYKEKGEKTKIANYRPITLLNTDYKLLTKLLSIRLAKAAPSIVHESQAGFVPGRKLSNHTQLAKMMISWAEATETNGAIVALDQEKAYDKIAHDYLWRVLQKFGVPESFIAMVKSLYAQAETSVLINGVLSSPYRVTRGVRQGDPLSCLLFNLAIEPLSAMIRKSGIRGINIPNCAEALKATLFADDTTSFLSAEDDFADLQKVTTTWCGAAKARFNISKTEIIPIGTPEYREAMVSTYRATGAWGNFPTGVRMAADGEPVRILGAWMGNGLNDCEIWSPKIESIRDMLERWTRSRPTLEGKRHVVQMFVGGMSQFLTTVQRMPSAVITRLKAVIRSYLWSERHTPPVRMEQMYLPVSQGGFGILDLEARNEAIDIMWLKSYLNYEKRPLWALLADDLLARTVPAKCVPTDATLRINSFLQNWKPSCNRLPHELKSMLKVAKKYGLRLEGRAFSRSILRNMPMWDHGEADKARIRRLGSRSRATACLKNVHKLMTVGDFEAFAAERDDPMHSKDSQCECDRCTSLRLEQHCADPDACYRRALDLLNTLPQKWDPRGEHPEDHEADLATRAEDTFEHAEGRTEVFDRRITTHGTLSDVFRIFTGPEEVCNTLPQINTALTGEFVTVATDGSCINNGQRNAQAGAGVFHGPQHPLNQSIRLPSTFEQTNQSGEIVAALLAAQTASNERHILQVTDSRTTMESVTIRRRQYENEGFIRQSNSELTKALIGALLSRQTFSAFTWVKGHNGHPANEAADQLAGQAAARTVGDEVDLNIDETLRLTGAKLNTMTQELAYKAIQKIRAGNAEARTSTAERVSQILNDIADGFSVMLPEGQLWRSLKKPVVTREARQWIWMVIHDGYMVGNRWLRPNMSDELRERAICKTCGQTETMQHILFCCNACGRETIWTLLRDCWEVTGLTGYDPDWGTILGAACAVIRPNGPDSKRDAAAEDRWAILAIESAHLIWKLRCERVITNDGTEFAERAVANRWYAALARRLDLERKIVALTPGKKRARMQTRLDAIWRPLVEGLTDQSTDWVIDSGVLVGIKRGSGRDLETDPG